MKHLEMKRVLALVMFLFVGLTAAMAQKVTGQVVDEQGEPLIAVSVIEKGTTNGTVTDFDGNFELTAKKGTILVFSYVGFISQELKAESTMKVVLKEDSKALEEVVVIGYGTTKAKNFTGSVDQVKMSDSPVADLNLSSTTDLLRGRITGVQMGAESASAGSRSSILVRGKKSIAATSSEPLIVLNGVIFSGTLDDIDPTTIESLSILKDATSLAAYGSKAANGVIMVATKKGKEGKPMINFSTSHQFSGKTYNQKYLSGKDYIRYKNIKNASTDLTDTGFMTAFEKANYDKGQETDWEALGTRTGYTQNYNVSISGAAERTNYFVSAGHNAQKGILLGNEFERNNLAMNVSTKVADWIEVGANMNYAYTLDGSVSAGTGFTMTPYGEPYLPDGRLRKFVDGQDATQFNPLWNTNGDIDKDNRRVHLTLGGFASINIPKVEGLNFKINASYSKQNSDNKSFTHESYYPALLSSDWDGLGYSATYYDLGEAGGSTSHNSTINWVMDYILSYSKAFGDHYISGSLVYTRDSQEAVGESYSGKGFATAGNTLTGWYGLGNAATQTVNSPSYNLHTDVGYLARVMWSFRDTYHLNASIRRDGSSVFGKDNKWGNFPAFGGAWTISNEKFMEGSKKWLDNLKLKLSWGKNGAQTLAPYGTLSTIVLGQGGGIPNYYDGNIHWGQAINALGNSGLGWQTTTSWNGGFEADVLNRRIHFEINAYKSQTTDQIFSRNIPVMGSGVTQQKATMGQVNNFGIEINASSTNIKKKDFRWTTDLTFTLNRNKLVELYGDGQDDITSSLFIGKSLGAIYGYEVSRINPENGTPLFINKDGEEVVTPKAGDRKILGYSMENFRMNLANTVTYKNWQVYVMLGGIFGGGGYGLQNNTFAYTTYDTGHSVSAIDVPFWAPDNKNTDRPSPAYTNPSGAYQIYNSITHIRLQDLSVSYNITSLVQKYGIKNAKLSLSGRNLFFIAPSWKMSDPQAASATSAYLPKAVTMALNVSF
ncbi:MAG: SusC/RagA family TonB-linked outer membrane protein [Bacteroidales bacterium]|nr:SusC/RagA family TonB-linked outer membrane protein [Bacteroidales bacterium]